MRTFGGGAKTAVHIKAEAFKEKSRVKKINNNKLRKKVFPELCQEPLKDL